MKMLRTLTVDNIETCRDCDLRYLCAGGCRAMAYSVYGDIRAYNRASINGIRQ